MESRIQRIFLTALLGLCLFNTAAWSEDDQQEPAAVEEVIQPGLQRRDVTVDEIDSEDFEVGIYAGIFSIEDFGSNPVIGARFAYHVSQDLFLEAAYGMTKADDSTFEQFVNSQFFNDRDFRYYNLSLGYNFLPGEAFVHDKWAFKSAVYVIGGVGSTEFADETSYTINFGFGYRLLLTDFVALHIDVRDHMFDLDSSGVGEKTTHNLEFHTSVTMFF